MNYVYRVGGGACDGVASKPKRDQTPDASSGPGPGPGPAPGAAPLRVEALLARESLAYFLKVGSYFSIDTPDRGQVFFCDLAHIDKNLKQVKLQGRKTYRLPMLVPPRVSRTFADLHNRGRP
jgi:hypothetical protein